MDMQDIADQISTAVNNAEAGLSGQGNDDGDGNVDDGDNGENKDEGVDPSEDGTPEPKDTDTLPEGEDPKPDKGEEDPDGTKGEEDPDGDGQEQPWIKNAKKLYGDIPVEELGAKLHDSYQEIVERDQARDIEIKEMKDTMQNEWAKDPLFQEFIAVKYGGKKPKAEDPKPKPADGVDPNNPDGTVAEDGSLIRMEELPKSVQDSLAALPKLNETIKGLEDKVAKYEDERLDNASEDLIDDMCSRHDTFKGWIDSSEQAEADAKAKGLDPPPLPKKLQECFDLVKNRKLSLEEAFKLVTVNDVEQATRARTIKEMKDKGKKVVVQKGGGTAPSKAEAGTLNERIGDVVSGILSGS